MPFLFYNSMQEELMSNYKTLHKFGVDEYIVEKSTFIGYAKPIKIEEEAIEFINEIKKKIGSE